MPAPDDDIETRLAALETAMGQLQVVIADPRISRRIGLSGARDRASVNAVQQAQEVIELRARVAELEAAENARLKAKVVELETKAAELEAAAAASAVVETPQTET